MTKLAFITTGDTRTMPAPSDGNLEIQRASRVQSGAFETVSRAGGLAAPPPQLRYCVRAGEVLEGSCR